MPGEQLLVAGADGCRRGWLAILLAEGGGWEVKLFPDVAGLWERCGDARLVLLDVPIGLCEGGPAGRRCDREARRLLGRRRAASVFPAPCRAAVYAGTYEEASAVNEEATGRRLSIQTWNIVPRIREVDRLLARSPAAKERIGEVHPEVCFQALAGRPMRWAKKTEEGFGERLEVLRAWFPAADAVVAEALAIWRRREVARDDVVDALVAAVSGLDGVEGLASLPETPELDARGLPMQMVYRRRGGAGVDREMAKGVPAAGSRPMSLAWRPRQIPFDGDARGWSSR